MTSGDMAANTPAKSERKTGFNPLWMIYAVLGFLVVGAIAFATFRPILVLPRITLAPGFALRDQNGQQLTNEDLRGHIVLYNFTHTTCSEPCPQTSTIMQAVQARLNEVDAGDIPLKLVTISFDPEHDTPAVLQDYAARLGADPQRWLFATGPAERLKWIIGGGFNIYYEAQTDGTFEFSPALMLVDGAGILRAEYLTATPDVDRILRDMNLIVEEAQNSEGATRLAYEAAHLFLCYPR